MLRWHARRREKIISFILQVSQYHNLQSLDLKYLGVQSLDYALPWIHLLYIIFKHTKCTSQKICRVNTGEKSQADKRHSTSTRNRQKARQTQKKVRKEAKLWRRKFIIIFFFSSASTQKKAKESSSVIKFCL